MAVARNHLGRAGLALIPALLLGGCEGGLPQFGETDGATAPAMAARSTEIVETDVEAPEVFQVSEAGLWDGRPSLGGVWVAHPDVDEPERVIIRNAANGQFVIGALFRRERENPGPALQVSSDAAEALGMLAGAPAPLNVTALRREEEAAPEPTEATAPVLVPDGPPAAAAPAAAATAPAIAPAIATTRLDTAAPEGTPAGVAPAAAPAAPSEGLGAVLSAILAGAPTVTPPATAAAVAAVPPSALARPFIQLGIFAIEANATATAAQMTALGLPARVVASTTQNQDFWRVLVGPASGEAERSAYLDRVRAAGFADAYPVAD